MATTITGWSAWAGTATAFRLRITLERTAVNIEKNQSTVRSRVWIESRGAGNFNYNSAHGHSIDGVQVYTGNINRHLPLPAPNEILVLDNSRTITHKADGTRSVDSAATFSNPVAGSHYAKVTLALDAIPRATTPAISGGGGFTTGAESQINLPRAASGFTHDVTYKVGSATGTIATGVGVSTKWTPAHSLASQFTNKTSATVEITVVTKSGSTTIGTKKVNFTLTLASNQVPSASAIYSEQNPKVSALDVGWLQNASQIKINVSGAGIHGSTITDKKVIVGGTVYNDGHVFSLASSGNFTFQARTTDSRGRTKLTPYTITVDPYEWPRIGNNGVKVFRANVSNVPTDDGKYLTLDAHLIGSTIKAGGAGPELNGLDISIETKASDGGWIPRQQNIKPGLTQSGLIQISDGQIAETTKSYEIRLTIVDELTAGTDNKLIILLDVATAITTLHFDGSNVGVGKYWEQGALDVAGDIYSSGVKVSKEGHTHTGAQVSAATETARGTVERATQAEVNTGTDTTRYVSPAGLRNSTNIPWAMAAGTVSVPGGSGAVTSATVTLPVGRFTQTPLITLSPSSGVPQRLLGPSHGDRSSSSFTIYLVRDNTGSTGIHWQAVQMTPTSATG